VPAEGIPVHPDVPTDQLGDETETVTFVDVDALTIKPKLVALYATPDALGMHALVNVN
jgi:hypothetical protein